MKIKQIISKSRDGNKMEVIGKDDSGYRTLHIQRQHDFYKYVVTKTIEGTKLLGTITK